MTPELIGILAVGATLIGVAATMTGLLLTLRRDARADMATFRTEMRTDMQDLRTEVRGAMAALRKDVQALTERVSRLEGVIEGLFGRRADRDRHDDAA